MKRKSLSVLTSLALFVGMLQLGGLALIFGPATQAMAAPAAINVGTVDMRMQRMSASPTSEDYSNADDCSRVSPASGNWTSWVTNPALARAGHGRSGNTCPAGVDLAQQSVIEVQPNNPGTVTEGAPFLLGSYKHFNNPINSGSNVRNYSKLQTRFLGTTLTLPWELWETPNDANPCPVGPQGVDCHDQLKFDIDVAPEVITYNGERYRMVVAGFVNVASAATACPANPTGLAVGDTFITAEVSRPRAVCTPSSTRSVPSPSRSRSWHLRASRCRHSRTRPARASRPVTGPALSSCRRRPPRSPR